MNVFRMGIGDFMQLWYFLSTLSCRIFVFAFLLVVLIMKLLIFFNQPLLGLCIQYQCVLQMSSREMLSKAPFGSALFSAVIKINDAFYETLLLP